MWKPLGNLHLSTPDVELRTLTPADATPLIAGWSLDPVAAEMLNMPQRAWTPHEQALYFSARDNRQIIGIFTRKPQQLVGMIDLKWSTTHGTFTYSKLIGVKQLRGTSVADQAGMLLLSHMFETLGYAKAKVNIKPQNKAAQWAVARAGWKLEAHHQQHILETSSQQRSDIRAFALLARDWRKQKQRGPAPAEIVP